MCGRTHCRVRVEDVGVACGFRGPLRTVDADRFNPSYNVTPGRYMPVVRHAPSGPHAGGSAKDQMEPVVQSMKWGLVPNFTKKTDKPDHFRMFNARSESVAMKPIFSRLLPKNRCVTTVEGFYEWKKDGTKKQPYFVHFEDGRPLVFAGLYDCWEDEEGKTLYTFTILTTRSSKAFDSLHDRMPVILPSQEFINSWLNDDLKNEMSLHKLTQPYEASDLVWYPVTSAMGKPMFDNPECTKELKPKVASDSKIAQLFGKVQKENHSSDSQLPHEIPESRTAEEDDNLLAEYERESLLAGMEPDHDMPQTHQKEQEIVKPGKLKDDKTEFQFDDQSFPEVSIETVSGKDKAECGEEGVEYRQQSFESSPVKHCGNDLPGSKRQWVSESTKVSKKKSDAGLSSSPQGVKKSDAGLPVSPKFAKKNVDTGLSNDKQSSLLSFFGKQ